MADPTTRLGASQRGLSGLTDDEARGFHKMFITSFLIFVAIAIVAHFAVWQWRPWIPGVSGYKVSATQSTPAPTNTTATAVATR